jgi:hypothetical protein
MIEKKVADGGCPPWLRESAEEVVTELQIPGRPGTREMR